MPKPEEHNSSIDQSSDEMSKDFSSQDRNTRMVFVWMPGEMEIT